MRRRWCAHAFQRARSAGPSTPRCAFSSASACARIYHLNSTKPNNIFHHAPGRLLLRQRLLYIGSAQVYGLKKL